MTDDVPDADVRYCAGLTAEELALVASLERRVVAADGGRLKLEWQTLRTRDGRRPEDLLCFHDGRLVGFAGLYSFGPTVEVAGMVDPSHRRRGVGSQLLAAARDLVRARGGDELLLVCPRTGSGGGAAFATRHGGRPDHSEHALVLTGAPADGPTDPRLTLRRASSDDAARIAELLEHGFGHPPGDVAARLADPLATSLVAEHDGAVIGYLRLSNDDGVGGVYGFVIDAPLRGRGVGRDVLRRSCALLRDEGATWIGLEVATDNEHALGLYTSLGFEPVTTEEYFAVSVADA